ncbi:uncharacterized protein EDB93DRAFT_1144322 [Suillus bovinus]|uniref:uncharacterized protein n=1 Tax=Suillus bovinus TaxID=48563 RepID=UPI001B8867B3|nr:uncharacterized protein EDB93DRAFT_1144322 [Suillus bovinus]KAG2148696.1 hypothetical protein EDB93DRAFT_1144322 [Suillus bovinus]
MVRFNMFRSLLRFPTKPRSHEDAEKELAEVMDLFSKYPSYLVETDKTEFRNEYERLQREIQSHKARESTAKLRNADMILEDCRALKSKVTVAIVRGEVPAPTGIGAGHEKSNPPPARDVSETKSYHSNQPPNIKTIASLPTTGTSAIDKTPFKPQSGVPSVNTRASLPQSHHLPVHANLKQAISQVTSGISREVDSIVMVGTSAKCPTLNIDSQDCTGASVRNSNPITFMNVNYSSNSSIILRNSNAMGATLNINATNSSGAVFHRGDHPKRVR